MNSSDIFRHIMESDNSSRCLPSLGLIFMMAIMITICIIDNRFGDSKSLSFHITRKITQSINWNMRLLKKSDNFKLSPLYSDLGLHVYGEWAEGYLHNRITLNKEDYLIMCNKSKNEKSLHFVFYDKKLNEIDVAKNCGRS